MWVTSVPSGKLVERLEAETGREGEGNFNSVFEITDPPDSWDAVTEQLSEIVCA